MKVTFLGTCACDFSPLLKTEFKDKFDNDARRASAILIDDRFMIDCSIHGLDSIRIANKDMDKITDIFITHIHYDHFTPANIAVIAEGKSVPLRLWVREDANVEPINNVEIIRMKPYETYAVDEGVTVMGLIANHNEESTPQHFIFEKEGKKLFYGCDGGWFISSSYNALRRREFDVFILDCTVGDKRQENPLMAVHNNIPMIKMMMPTLRMERAVTDKTRVFISHMAPMFHRPHAETCEIMDGTGVEVAYDGLEFNV